MRAYLHQTHRAKLCKNRSGIGRPSEHLDVPADLLRCFGRPQDHLLHRTRSIVSGAPRHKEVCDWKFMRFTQPIVKSRGRYAYYFNSTVGSPSWRWPMHSLRIAGDRSFWLYTVSAANDMLDCCPLRKTTRCCGLTGERRRGGYRNSPVSGCEYAALKADQVPAVSGCCDVFPRWLRQHRKQF